MNCGSERSFIYRSIPNIRKLYNAFVHYTMTSKLYISVVVSKLKYATSKLVSGTVTVPNPKTLCLSKQITTSQSVHSFIKNKTDEIKNRRIHVVHNVYSVLFCKPVLICITGSNLISFSSVHKYVCVCVCIMSHPPNYQKKVCLSWHMGTYYTFLLPGDCAGSYWVEIYEALLQFRLVLT